MSRSKKSTSSPRPEEKKKEAEDVFVEKTLEAAGWAKQNSQALILAAIVAVVLIAGGLYYRNYRATWEDQAIARLEQVQTTLAMGERESAKSDLRQYLEQFDGSVYALEARLILGQALLEDDEAPEAIDVLAPAVREMASQPIGLQAGFLMAAAYEEAAQPEEAERLYLRIANTAELTFQLRESIAGAARIRTARGDLQGAAELYQDVLDDMDEGDPQRSFWEMRLAEVRG